MKRILFSAAIAAALGAGSFAGFRALNPAERQLSDIELANIEALADKEIELPEVVITCNTGGQGQCYKYGHWVYDGEYSYRPCQFTGKMSDYCMK